MQHNFDSAILALAMNKSATNLAIATKGGKVIVRCIQQHDDKNGSTVMRLANDVFSAQRLGPVRSALFSKDEKQLVFGGYDKILVIVDTRLWVITRELKVEGTINVLSSDSQERYLAVGARDKSIVLFDTSSWCPIKTIHTPGWVTSISWRSSSDDYQDIVAVRSESRSVSILDFTPVRMTGINMTSNNDPESSTSWTRLGHYIARSKGNNVVIANAREGFSDQASFDTGGYVRCLSFCTAEDKADLLAVVNTTGYLFVLRLVVTDSGVTLQVDHSSFIEEHLWVVAWSADGKLLGTGGRNKILHLFNTSSFKTVLDPMPLGGRLWGIDFIPQAVIGNVGKKFCVTSSMVLGTGDYLATLYDGTSYLASLQVKRTRTVRCVKYHPWLPLLAIGDGSNHVVIVDFCEEEIMDEFHVGGRVNCLDFSNDGNFLVVGTDDCRFTIHETLTFKAVQEISSTGFATSASFSPTGEFLVLGCVGDDYNVVRLGPLLATDLVPLRPTSELSGLPPWALNEALFRSGNGPSLVQRYMLDGSPESVLLVATLLKRSPDALYTFDRTTGKGCFDTALSLQKPNLLKLTLTILVDGTLEAETNNGGKRSILTTDLPERGSEALYNMIFNQPQLINDILAEITFIKVPFTVPHEYHRKETHEMGSDSYVDPWLDTSSTKQAGKLDFDKQARTLYRIPAVLPLPGLGTMKFLGALIDNTPPTVFENDAMGLVLRVMWYYHLRKWFLLDVCVYLVFYALWIVYVDWTASTTARTVGDGMETSEGAIAVSLLILNSLFALKEAVQSARSGERASYFRSPWNVIDFVCILLVYSYIFFTVTRGGAGNGLVPLVVFATLFLTLKLLAYLRGFGDTGWLISVLRNNMWDVRGFLVILACCLLGFALAFRVLFGDIEGLCIDEACTVDPFGTYTRSLMSTFELAVLGVYDPAILSDSRFRVLSAIVFVLAVMSVLVVALNALIAVLSDSYTRVQERAVANRRRERAELIFQYLCILPSSRRKIVEDKTRYFHSLLEADEDGDLLVSQYDWQGGLNAMRRELQQDQLRLTEANHRAMDELRNELSTNIAGLQKQMIIMLDDLSEEVKEMKTMHQKKSLVTDVARAVKFIK
jgi:WD40 repeat protein